ncbi:MAG: hypothetical protein ACK5WK_04375, partial [Hyphomonadaceae bacterium]
MRVQTFSAGPFISDFDNPVSGFKSDRLETLRQASKHSKTNSPFVLLPQNVVSGWYPNKKSRESKN